MWLRIKYFLFMYAVLMDFLEDNSLTGWFRKDNNIHSIIKYLWKHRVSMIDIFTIEGRKNTTDYYARMWQDHCRNQKEYHILMFLLFLDSDASTYAFKRLFHNNSNEVNIEQYLTDTTPKQFISKLMAFTKGEEHKFWWKINMDWNKRLKML